VLRAAPALLIVTEETARNATSPRMLEETDHRQRMVRERDALELRVICNPFCSSLLLIDFLVERHRTTIKSRVRVNDPLNKAVDVATRLAGPAERKKPRVDTAYRRSRALRCATCAR